MSIKKNDLGVGSDIDSCHADVDHSLYRFRDIISRLRSQENGCPWDLKQTHDSLRPYFLEEVYEFFAALNEHDMAGMAEELGDVLLQVYLHARILEEKTNGRININTVAQGIVEKMERRHPHIFNSNFAPNGISPEEVEQNWREIKKIERSKTEPIAGQSLLEKYRKYPLLARVEGLFRDIKKIGFCFDNKRQALLKVREEIDEALEKFDQDDAVGLHEELGDVFLASCSAAVETRLSPEELLFSALQKFEIRYQRMMELVALKKQDFALLNYPEKCAFWAEAKKDTR